jgi:hypothetical protein
LDKEENPMYDKFLTSLGFYNESLSLFEDEDIRKCNRLPIYKYTHTNPYLGNSGRRTEIQRDANFIYYRYADIILMQAECLAETGKIKEAYQKINEIRTRAGVPTIASSNSISDFRQNLIQERALEFAMEGKRWFDVLRYTKKNHYQDKTLITKITLTKANDPNTTEKLKALVKDTMFYYLPIPSNEIKVNNKLEQNPLYD